MSLKTTYFFIALFWIISFSSQDEVSSNHSYIPVEQKQEFTAGESIELKFKTVLSTSSSPHMIISYNSGSTLVIAQAQNENVVYKIPRFISEAAGHVSWRLNNTTIYGAFKIKPDNNAVKMETYVGPPSIIAGTTDYSMVVTIPVDVYDNPMEDGTAVNFHYNKDELNSINPVEIKDLIAFDYVSSHTKTGDILLATNHGDTFSKEYMIEIQAGLPVDFTLSRKRNHNYADGNQLVTFYTSILKDSYGNEVSDGTLVNFYITTNTGVILQTTGTTIKGIATATMIHPEKAISWSVKAVVDGIATSDIIKLEFQAVFDTYNVELSQDNRKVTVGPLKSFMGQIIPDGLTVELIIEGDKINEEYLKKSYNGIVNFELDINLIPIGIYDLKIIAGGVTQTIKNVKL